MDQRRNGKFLPNAARAEPLLQRPPQLGFRNGFDAWHAANRLRSPHCRFELAAGPVGKLLYVSVLDGSGHDARRIG